MPEEKKYFNIEGTTVEIPTEELDDFRKNVPDAIEVKPFIIDNDTLAIPLNEVDEFISNVPNAKPLITTTQTPTGTGTKAAKGVMSSVGKPQAEPVKSGGSGSAMKSKSIELQSQLPTTLTAQDVQSQVEQSFPQAKMLGLDYEAIAEQSKGKDKSEAISEVQDFGNYEQVQSYFAKVDRAKREIVDNKNSSYSLPMNEEGRQIYLDATSQQYDLIKRKADLAQKKMADKLTPIISKDIDRSYLRKNEDGFLVPDVDKVDEYAKNIAKTYGLPEDGFFKEVVYNEAKSMASFKELEPDIEKRFNEKLSNSDVKESLEKIGKEQWKGFTTDDVENLKLEKTANELFTTLQEESNKVQSEVQLELKNQVIDLDNSWENIQQKSDYDYAQIEQAYKSGQIPYEEYTTAFNQIKSQTESAYAQYSDERLKLFDDSQKALNQISNKYNARYRRQVDELTKIAKQKVDNAAIEYSKKIDNSAADEIIKKLYTQAYSEVATSKGESVSKYNQARAVELQIKYGQFGGIAAMADRFFRASDQALGGSLKGLGTTFGIEQLQLYGDYLESSVTLPQARTKEIKDLFDPMNLAQISGQLTGSMTPAILASASTALVTKNAPVAYRIAATGAASFFAESSDIAGRMWDETFASTNSVAKANENAAKSWESQYKIIPLYAFSGLPFIETGISKLPFLGRIAVGASAEIIEEIPQELTQNIAEENIRAGKDPFDDYLEKVTEDDFARLKETSISVAPVAILGGLGQLGSNKTLSKKEILKRQVESYASKVKVNEIVGGLQNQWVSQMVSKKGESFAISTINSLFADGTIDEQTRDLLQNKVEQSKKNFSDAKELGLNESESVVYDALVQSYADKKAQYEKAKESGDEILMASLEKELNNIKLTATDFSQTKQGNFFVFRFPDGSSKVVTNSIWSSNQDIINLINNGQLGVEAFSEEGKKTLDLLGQKMLPQNATAQAQVQQEQESSSMPNTNLGSLQESVEARRLETEIKIKRKDLFSEGGVFANELGGSGINSVATNHTEINGIEFVEFSNPNTGVVDVIMTGTSDNDFVGYYRLYEDGQPTNKWSSKFENQSRNKADFKTMISGVQSMLPKGHEYTEKTSISTDGLRVWNQQLSRGYELQYDEDGNLVTNRVAINGDAIENELGIPVNRGGFDNISVTNNADMNKVRQALLPYLQNFGLNESNIHFENGTAEIDLPVLLNRQGRKSPQIGTSSDTRVDEISKKLDDLTEKFIKNGKTRKDAEDLALQSITEEERQVLRDSYSDTQSNQSQAAQPIDLTPTETTQKEQAQRRQEAEIPSGNYEIAQEVTTEVSKENPNASVLLTPKGNDLSLTAVFVPSERRNQGIGTKVLESVKKQADRVGKKVVLEATNELDSETDVARLGNFYERNGFTRTGENTFEYDPSKKESIEARPMLEIAPTDRGQGQVGQESAELRTQETVEEEVNPALKDIESTAKALEGVNTFDQQDAKAEVIVGKEKDRWGRSQVWRERIENAGDILRELSSRGNTPDIRYLKEKIEKIKKWVLDGTGFTELPKNIKNLKDVDESNVRFSSAVDGKEYLDKFHNDVLQETIDAYKSIVVKTQEEQVIKDFILTLLQGDKSSIYSKLRDVEDIIDNIKRQGELKSTPLNLSEAYHKAKADGSNPELVRAVEELLTPKPQEDAVQEQTTDEGVLRQERPEMGLQEVEQGNQEEVVAEESQVQEEVAVDLYNKYKLTTNAIYNKLQELSDLYSGRSVEDALRELGVEDADITAVKEQFYRDFISQELPSKLPIIKNRFGVDELPQGEVKVKPINKPEKVVDAKTTREKSALLKDIVGADDLRPVMSGVFNDSKNKKLVATDGFSLLAIKDTSIKEDAIISPKTGQKIDGRFPNYEAVIPKENPIKQRVSVSEILGIARAANRASQFFGKKDDRGILVSFKIGDDTFLFSAKLMEDVFTVLARLGKKNVTIELSAPNRAAVINDGDVTALIMPIMANDESAFPNVNIITRQKVKAEIENQQKAELDYIKRKVDDRKAKVDQARADIRNAKTSADLNSANFDFKYETERYNEALKELEDKKADIANLENPLQEQEDINVVKEAINNGEITEEQAANFIKDEQPNEIESVVKDIESKAESENEVELNDAVESANSLIAAPTQQEVADPFAAFEAISQQLGDEVKKAEMQKNWSDTANKIAKGLRKLKNDIDNSDVVMSSIPFAKQIASKAIDVFINAFEAAGLTIDAFEAAYRQMKESLRTDADFNKLNAEQQKALAGDLLNKIKPFIPTELETQKERQSKFGNRVTQAYEDSPLYKNADQFLNPNYFERKQKEVEKFAEKLKGIFPDKADRREIALEGSMPPDVKVAILGDLLKVAKEDYETNPTQENLNVVTKAKQDLQDFGTGLGQGASYFQRIYELFPELQVEKLQEDIDTQAENAMGKSESKNTANDLSKSRKVGAEVKRIRNDVFNAIGNALQGIPSFLDNVSDSKVKSALKTLLNFGKLMDVSQKELLSGFIAQVKESGKLAVASTKQEVEAIVRENLSDINGRLTNPYSEKDFNRVVDAFMELYENLATKAIEQEIERQFPTKKFSVSKNNNSKVAKLILYGALDDVELRRKFALKYGIPYIGDAEAKKLQDLAQRVDRSTGGAKKQAQRELTNYINKIKRGQGKVATFVNRYMNLANDLGSYIINNILFNFSTPLLAMSSNVFRVGGAIGKNIITGNTDAIRFAFNRAANENVTLGDGKQRKLSLNPQRDAVLAALSGIPRLAEYTLQGVSVQESKIRQANTKTERDLRRIFNVASLRLYSAIDATVTPFYSAMQNYSVYKKLIKKMYADNGYKGIDDITLDQDVKSLLGFDTTNFDEVANQAYADVMNSTLMQDLIAQGSWDINNEFPDANSRRRPNSAAAQIYNEYITRIYEIHGEGFNQRFFELQNKNSTSLMQPFGFVTEEGDSYFDPTIDYMKIARDIDRFVAKNTNEIAFFGTPPGTFGFIAELTGKLGNKLSPFKFAGYFPIFNNAMWNAAAYSVKMYAGLNLLQYASYKATGRRRFLSQKPFDSDFVVKLDQQNMAVSATVSSAMAVALATYLSSLYDTPDDEKEALVKGNWTGAVTKLTSAQRNTFRDANGDPLKEGMFYMKGKPIFPFNRTPLHGIFEAGAYEHNSGIFNNDYRDNALFLEDDKESEAWKTVGAYLINGITVSLKTASAKEMADVISAIAGVNPDQIQDDKFDRVAKDLENKIANLASNLIPYNRAQKQIADFFYTAEGFDKKRANTFLEKIIIKTAFSNYILKSNLTDPFGRPLTESLDVQGLTMGFNIFELKNGEVRTILDVAYENDPYMQLHISRNYGYNAPHTFKTWVRVDIGEQEKSMSAVEKEIKSLKATGVDARIPESEKPRRTDESVDYYEYLMTIDDEEINIINEAMGKTVFEFVNESGNMAMLQKGGSITDKGYKDLMNAVYDYGRQKKIYELHKNELGQQFKTNVERKYKSLQRLAVSELGLTIPTSFAVE